MYSHGFLKVAAASPNCRLGDPMYNVEKMIEVLREASKKDPAMICFPELCITGYSIGDLIFQKSLYDSSLIAIKYLLDHNPYLGVIIFGSYVVINDTLYNCVFVAQNNKVLGIIPKRFLPHTNEFYESRWFQSGDNVIKEVHHINICNQEIPFGKIIFENEGKDVLFGAEVCADLWAPNSPNENLYANGAMIVFNASASPSHVGKKIKRRLLTKSTSLKFNGAYVYVSNNASESTSETVFSGHKLISENGLIISEDDEISFDSSIIYGDIDIQKLHHLRRNNSYFKIVQDISRDLDIQYVKYSLKLTEEYSFEKQFDILPFVPKTEEDYLDIINIQAHSIIKRIDYVKTKKTILGVSGGLDSTLALLSLCYGYDKYNIDRKNIIAVSLPSKQTSSTTYNNGKGLADKLGVTFMEVPIEEDVIRQLKTIGHSLEEKDVTYENVQARFRTYTLMNLANLHKAVVVGTSDMSEVALGWSTFNGDQMAMYGVNAGLTKTAVKAVVKYYEKIYPEVKDILESILDTPISPELSGNDQKTEDIIGKYEINDFILYHFLVDGDEPSRIVYLLTKVFNLDQQVSEDYVSNFNNRFYTQQYKRLTAPEAAKILQISLSPRTEIRLNGDLYQHTYKNKD